MWLWRSGKNTKNQSVYDFIHWQRSISNIFLRKLFLQCTRYICLNRLEVLSWKHYTTDFPFILHLTSREWEPAGTKCLLKTPTTQFMLHSVSSNEKGCLSLALLSNHRAVPMHNTFPLQTKQSTPLRCDWHLYVAQKKSIVFNVRIQLLFSIVFPPRALHYTLPFLLWTPVWLVSAFYLHLLRPPYFSLINV